MTQNKRQNLLREGAVLVLVIAAVAVSEYVFFQLWRLDWQVPMLYGGDGIYWVGQVQRSYGDLTPALGWPFYQPPSPYEPNYDLIYDAFVAFVGLFTQNTGIVFNLYVLAIPFANALAGYAVFRLAGVRRWLAFARPGKGFFRNRRNWAALAMAWGIANNGAAYYPYFTCFFLCVTALCLILRDRRLAAGVPCFVTIGEIVAWMIPDFFPMVLGMLAGVGSTLTNGVYRSPIGADIYSLRISSLLLSPNGYGWDKLANWLQRYFRLLATDEGPMYNENGYGYLGIVGIFGFLALLALLFHTRRWQAGRTPAPQPDDRLWLLARLNVAALLLASIASFGGLIGILLRFIRGYNRISPYIAFFALLAAALWAEHRLQNGKGRGKTVFAVALAAVLAYGYWEQQSLFAPKYEEVQTTWRQDAAFMQEVEAAAGQDAVLFQLPYMKNFENGSVNNMWDYTLLRGPLHSDTLRFSYGAGYGTENDTWYKATSELAPQAMVQELRAQGVAGIYLDLDGYAPQDQQQTLDDLIEAAGCAKADCIAHESGMIWYIPLA